MQTLFCGMICRFDLHIHSEYIVFDRKQRALGSTDLSLWLEYSSSIKCSECRTGLNHVYIVKQLNALLVRQTLVSKLYHVLPDDASIKEREDKVEGNRTPSHKMVYPCPEMSL